MDRTCADCGVDISERGNAAKRCGGCARKYRKEHKREKQRICLDCGTDISERGNAAKRCVECVRKYRKEHDSKPEVKERKRVYYQRPDVKKRMRAYGKAHGTPYRNKPEVKERKKAYSKVWRKEHDSKPEVKEKKRAYGKAYRKEHKPEAKAYGKAYRKEHGRAYLLLYEKMYRSKPEVIERRRVHSHLYRARKRDQVGEVDPNIYTILFAAQKGRCAAPKCRKKLKSTTATSTHIDHIMPLAKKGKHDNKNLQLLCAFCNLSKQAKHPAEWLKEQDTQPMMQLPMIDLLAP